METLMAFELYQKDMTIKEIKAAVEHKFKR